MRLSEDQAVLSALKATGEIYSKQVSTTAGIMFLADLEQYSSVQVLKALSKCRRELKFFPSVADVIARIDDGRPGVEEAWAMLPKSEDASVVWSDEMAAAFGVVSGQIEDDPIAARMAFKEVYIREVASAREAHRPVRWTQSMGHNPRLRAAALNEAVAKGRMSIEHAREICPEIEDRSSGAGGLQRLGFSDLMKSIPKLETETDK